MKNKPALFSGFSMEGFRAGDDAMFQKIFDAFLTRLYVISYTMLKDQGAAEDAVAESMYSLWRHKEKIESPDHLEGFLYVSTRNSCINELRKRKHKKEAQQSFYELFNDQKESRDILEAEIRYLLALRMIEEAIEALPPGQKEVFRLLYIEQKSVNEIAAVMGVAVSTVYNQMRSGTKKIRKKLKSSL